MDRKTLGIAISGAAVGVGLAELIRWYLKAYKRSCYMNNVTPMNNFKFSGSDYADQDYVQIPDVLVSRIKEEDWSILELCAGIGSNLLKLREAGVDILGFDIKTNDLVEYGLAGTLEHLYPDRTLMLLCGFESVKTVKNYLRGGGKRVILGGYANSGEYKTEYVTLLSDMSNPCKITTEKYLTHVCGSADSYNNDIRKIVIRPCQSFMEEQGLVLKEAYFGPHSSGAKNGVDNILCYFQIWEIEEVQEVL